VPSDEVELIGRYSLLQRRRCYAETARWLSGDQPAPAETWVTLSGRSGDESSDGPVARFSGEPCNQKTASRLGTVVRVAEVGDTVEASFGEGFEEYAVGDMARLTRLASMLTRDRESAHDLVQETLVRVGCAWNRIDRDGSPSGYATTTMSRLAWRQSARSRTEWTLLNRHAPTETAPDDFSRVDDATSLRTAMHQLGPRQRAVLVLRFYADLSEAEVARMLGCSVGTIKSQASRGLAHLRTHLQRDTQRLDDQEA